MKLIREWDLRRKPWRITDIGRTGREVYINLGSADKLQPQVTFSIHPKGRDGRLNPVPKGTLEVVSIKGPHLALARITSLARGSDKDPILKSDYLFNPTWDPNSRKRIVLAGLADLNEDRSDTTKVLRQLLERQEWTWWAASTPAIPRSCPSWWARACPGRSITSSWATRWMT